MGQYFIAVNKTKKEYVTAWEIGGLAKLWEWCANHEAGIFPYLLRRNDGSGGGDVDNHIPNPEYAGRWAGDEVYLSLASGLEEIQGHKERPRNEDPYEDATELL